MFPHKVEMERTSNGILVGKGNLSHMNCVLLNPSPSLTRTTHTHTHTHIETHTHTQTHTHTYTDTHTHRGRQAGRLEQQDTINDHRIRLLQYGFSHPHLPY